MKDWIKGLIFLIIGNVLNNVIPYWISQYLLSLPNPFYSIGSLMQNLPSIQDLTAYNPNAQTAIGFIGIAFIGYAMYLFFRRLYKDASI